MKHPAYKANDMAYRISSKLMMALLFCLVLFSCSQKSSTSPEVFTASSSLQQQSKKIINTALYQQGILAMSNHDYSSAEKIFRAFIREHPTLSGTYLNLALIRFKNEEFEESLKLANKAIELNSKMPQAYNLRAQLMLKDGEIHRAKDDYLRAITLKPDYINAQYNLALLYDIYIQDIAKAIQHYENYLPLLKQPDERTQEWIDHLKNTLKNG